jgi:FMN phosphatase YigB (HAD superfamily)
MPIRAVIFDIGGILEVVPQGGDPSAAFPQLFTAWERRLGRQPGELHAALGAMDDRLAAAGKDGALGTCTEEEWIAELRRTLALDDEQLAVFLDEFWDVYMGEANGELIAYFAALRPRYRTALLSNSFVGAREREQARFAFALTCERLGVRPEEAIFLDDAPGHVAAASALGLHALLFTSNARAIAALDSLLASSAPSR